MPWLYAAWALALPIACGAAPDRAAKGGDAAEGGAGDGAGSSSGSGDEGSAVDVGGNDSPGGDTGAIDAGGDGGQPCPSDPAPPTLASAGTVTFVVTNSSAADRYVVTQGQGCDAFAIGGQSLSLPFQCGCECAVPQTGFTLTTVAAGQTVTLTWDGRHVVAYTTQVECGPSGTAPPPYVPPRCAMVTGGSAQPVPAGPLAVSIAYATQVPTSASLISCTSTSGGFQCRVMSSQGTNQQCGMGAYGLPMIQYAMQSFTLPASGGVTVPVSIP
jgi:hypothetical protein